MKTILSAVFIIIMLFTIHPVIVFSDDCQNKISQTYEKSKSDESTDLGERLYDNAELLFNQATIVHYRHVKKYPKYLIKYDDNHGCEIITDCSGFVSYLLYSLFPEHYKEINKVQHSGPYPLSKNYADFFSGLDAENPSDGWIRIKNYRELKKGDIIAWRKPGRIKPGDGTGHVMIVIETPSAISSETVKGETIRYLSIFVIDSSSIYHFKPEFYPPKTDQTHRDGLGKGYIKLILDEADNVIGYWEGTYSGEKQKKIKSPTFCKSIYFGRIVPIQKPIMP